MTAAMMWLGRALAMRYLGQCQVAPGICVRLALNGDHVAVAYGGQAGRVDREYVIECARAALIDWPAEITQLHIVVSPAPGELTLSEQAARARAEAKREQRALRPWGTTTPPARRN